MGVSESESKSIKKHTKVIFPDSEYDILEVYFELLKCHDQITFQELLDRLYQFCDCIITLIKRVMSLLYKRQQIQNV
ncbi:unnamed protein product [Paramecium pentaurelia]|uniref:Uncharacterized protein n=1 Tax=Paramecium pentaurelia TaxID=43138 RepID=A0A8S1XFF7_9CILI|nr:unnamed protein product [Paramecium pentaurelia]